MTFNRNQQPRHERRVESAVRGIKPFADNKNLNLEKYLNKGLKTLIKDALKNTKKNPAETAFFLKFARSAVKAEALRHKAGKNGRHIPSFLIASVTSKCNLNCSGCYDKARKGVSPAEELKTEDWRRIFSEAVDLGISAVILAGGEPLMRKDVIEEAAHFPSILFPVFTNGTMLNAQYLTLFEKYRNLVPVISIEGGEKFTDARRGSGIYSGAAALMQKLEEPDLLFGVSITVTNKNLSNALDAETISSLEKMGCKVAVFTEYVPVADKDSCLSCDDRIFLEKRIAELKKKTKLILVSFPGDEKLSGGCLAAGRGFFHISAAGNAEPCPFSPYSDTNIKNIPLAEALDSPLFKKLQSDNTLLAEHEGGCVLFDKASYVEKLAET